MSQLITKPLWAMDGQCNVIRSSDTDEFRQPLERSDHNCDICDHIETLNVTHLSFAHCVIVGLFVPRARRSQGRTNGSMIPGKRFYSLDILLLFFLLLIRPEKKLTSTLTDALYIVETVEIS